MELGALAEVGRAGGRGGDGTLRSRASNWLCTAVMAAHTSIHNMPPTIQTSGRWPALTPPYPPYTQILQRRIEVHAVGMPLVVMGEGHPGAPLSICYMRHAFGLGEHYNSTQPLQTAPAGEGADSAADGIAAAAFI